MCHSTAETFLLLIMQVIDGLLHTFVVWFTIYVTLRNIVCRPWLWLLGSHPSERILPLELELMIISHLQDDLDALGACALVCRSWSLHSRRYLFRALDLDDNDLTSFGRLLASAPDIGSSIQDLKIIGKENVGSHFVRLGFLLDIVSRLPQLQRLVARNIPFAFDTNVVPRPLSRQHLKCMKLVSETCSSIDFLMNIMGIFAGIDNLELIVAHPSIGEVDEIRSPDELQNASLLPSHKPTRIRAIKAIGTHLHWFPVFHASLLGIGALEEPLGELELFIDFRSEVESLARSNPTAVIDESVVGYRLLDGYRALLRALGPAVTALDIDFLHAAAAANPVLPPQWDGLGLSSCPNLCTLRLYLDISTPEEDADSVAYMRSVLANALQAYAKILEGSGPLPALRLLVLHVELGVNFEADAALLSPDMEWDRFDSILSRLPTFKFLFLSARYLRAPPPEALRDRLPRLSRMEKLKFRRGTPAFEGRWENEEEWEQLERQNQFHGEIPAQLRLSKPLMRTHLL